MRVTEKSARQPDLREEQKTKISAQNPQQITSAEESACIPLQKSVAKINFRGMYHLPKKYDFRMDGAIILKIFLIYFFLFFDVTNN